MSKVLVERGGSTRKILKSESVAKSAPVKEAERSAIIDRAIEVIGDEAAAMRWLGSPIRALDYATPISLLHRPQGREAVLTVLGRLEHGIV